MTIGHSFLLAEGITIRLIVSKGLNETEMRRVLVEGRSGTFRGGKESC